MRSVGILLISLGLGLTLLGLAIVLAARFPFLGHLPGDLHIRGKNWSFSFPLTTCIVLSVVLTVLLNVLLRFLRK